jgi:hypothetical protein
MHQCQGRGVEELGAEGSLSKGAMVVEGGARNWTACLAGDGVGEVVASVGEGEGERGEAQVGNGD